MTLHYYPGRMIVKNSYFIFLKMSDCLQIRSERLSVNMGQVWLVVICVIEKIIRKQR